MLWFVAMWTLHILGKAFTWSFTASSSELTPWNNRSKLRRFQWCSAALFVVLASGTILCFHNVLYKFERDLVTGNCVRKISETLNSEKVIIHLASVTCQILEMAMWARTTSFHMNARLKKALSPPTRFIIFIIILSLKILLTCGFREPVQINSFFG